jgi:lipoprotein-anchoring transpeptidase ErfK/SrfK
MARTTKLSLAISAALAFASVGLASAPSKADFLFWASPRVAPSSPVDRYVHDDRMREERPAAVAARFRRQVVNYPSNEAPGTIIIDTPNTYLYYVLGGGKAIRYGIGVGREGFTWSGVEHVTRMNEWPDWTPPPQMIARQPYLPRFMAGGPGNPMGARALYLGDTVYRIHGTNDPTTIGQRMSSGCIRLANADVIDLYGRAKVGAKVIVLPMSGRRTASVRSSHSAD